MGGGSAAVTSEPLLHKQLFSSLLLGVHRRHLPRRHLDPASRHALLAHIDGNILAQRPVAERLLVEPCTLAVPGLVRPLVRDIGIHHVARLQLHVAVVAVARLNLVSIRLQLLQSLHATHTPGHAILVGIHVSAQSAIRQHQSLRRSLDSLELLGVHLPGPVTVIVAAHATQEQLKPGRVDIVQAILAILARQHRRMRHRTATGKQVHKPPAARQSIHHTRSDLPLAALVRSTQRQREPRVPFRLDTLVKVTVYVGKHTIRLCLLVFCIVVTVPSVAEVHLHVSSVASNEFTQHPALRHCRRNKQVDNTSIVVNSNGTPFDKVGHVTAHAGVHLVPVLVIDKRYLVDGTVVGRSAPSKET